MVISALTGKTRENFIDPSLPDYITPDVALWLYIHMSIGMDWYDFEHVVPAAVLLQIPVWIHAKWSQDWYGAKERMMFKAALRAEFYAKGIKQDPFGGAGTAPLTEDLENEDLLEMETWQKEMEKRGLMINGEMVNRPKPKVKPSEHEPKPPERPPQTFDVYEDEEDGNYDPRKWG